MKFYAIGGLCMALLLAGNAWPQGGVITTFAGGPFLFTGNGQPAVNAPLGSIYGITLDPSGNVVIADTGNCLIERINPDGSLSVIAGNGITADVHTGDGGPALNAALAAPYGVAYDSQGNLYIAEMDRISRVSTQGIITTYAGGGSDATSNGIPALKASVSPASGGIVVDASGTVYFSDYPTNRVRKVTPDGTINTVAGTGTAGLSGDGGPATAATLVGPFGLALDRAGNLYITDTGNLRVRKVTPAGIISTFLTNTYASGVAFDSNGVFYVSGAGRIEKLTPGSSNLTLIGGTPGSFGFSGDGGPALRAQFALIMSIAADSQGNLFIGDEESDRVRRIAPNGIVTTVAGSGQFYYTGEGVSALTAPVEGGGNLAIDKAGNVYYSDPVGARVRKVSGGIINTVAGTGITGFSGDGGPATQAKIDYPQDLTFDAAGNLYIADWLNNRVRKVANGTISTYAQLQGNVWGLVFDASGNLYVSDESDSIVYRIDPTDKQTVVAGTGTAGFSGDGGPATQAMLNEPSGLALDALGNLYIADAKNGSVRMVTPQGVISTFAGGGTNVREVAFDSAGNLYVSDEGASLIFKFTPPSKMATIFAGGGSSKPGNGLLATQAILAPYGIVSDPAGNIYIDDLGVGIRVVLATPPTISLQQNSLAVSAASGGAPVTMNAAVQGSVQGLAFAVSATTASGGNWLSAGAASGNTPDLLSITADPSNLTPGSYTGTITIVPAAATPASLTLTVTFTVGAALPPQLSVDQPNLSFTYPAGTPARSETLKVSNAGGGALAFTVSAATLTGGSWLSVSPLTGSVSPGAPVLLTVTANPSNLPTGTYTGSLTIQSNGGGTIVVPVNLAISSLPQALLLTQTGMSFTGVAQGGVVPPQSFGIVNLGAGSLSWTASVSTLAGGNWLSAAPASGSSNASQAAPQVTVSVSPNGLTAGDYYGMVRIDAPGAANTPQVVTVFLAVLPAGSNPGASVQPAELFFTASPGGGSPGSQDVLVYSIGATALTFSTPQLSSSSSGSSSFSVDAVPYVGTLDPSQPTPVVVQPLGNFAAGTFSDFVNFQFSDGRIQTLKVNVIAGTSGSGTTGALRPRDSSTPCAPTKLIPALTTLSPAFAVAAGWPVALSVQSMDDCGNPQTSGSITVRFSNGDPPLALSSLNDGTWQATWATAQSGVGQPVTLNITATNNQLQLTGTSQVLGGLSSPKTPPAITQAGVVSAASFVKFTALAPGGLIAIFGNLLADDTISASSIPLPTTLGNAQVIIAGQPAPLLFVSPGQINAVVPFSLNTNTTQSLLIQRDLTLSSPVPINVADGQPAVFLNPSAIPYVFAYRGTAPAFLVTPSTPAQAGDVLLFYCAGLGVTNPPVADGVASPSSPLAYTQSSVTVTIGGQNANVIFAGLTPTLVGLYQVNLTMPAGVTPGNAVPVLLTVAGQTSPAAIIATQ
jgi:uncharacterized protein (TIGR03437 family)